MGFFRRHSSQLLLILALAALGALCSGVLMPAESRAVAQQLLGFPDSDVQAHLARPLLLGVLCFLPMLAAVAYATGGTLDRYVTRQFLAIFSLCLTTLFAIYLLMDLSDKLTDLRGADHFLLAFFTFYGTRLPAILLVLLPYSLLLALLYALGKLSTNREIIAMLQSGRGLLRITLPLMVAGGFCTLFSLGLSYHWGPTAEGQVDEILDQARNVPSSEATQVLYRNATNGRLWMIGAFPPNYQYGQPLRAVQVTTTDSDHRLQSRLFATSALWNRDTHYWTFIDALVGTYQAGQPPKFERASEPLVVKGWSETPWQLIKPGISATYLGIPELNSWLRANREHPPFADPAAHLTQWHYRWALPFTCLVTVLLATPLAIHFSRRGPGSGVVLAVVLSALMLLASNIMIAFGEAGIARPALAAWLPNIIFGLLGLDLFRRRITGRPIYQILHRLLAGRN